MKINAGTLVKRYNGRPVMIEQELYLQENGAPVMLNGALHLTNDREMTVGDIFSTILSSKKVSQFNVLKADVLARRFYGAASVDIDESTYSSLVEVIDQNDQFVPFVLAYAKRALIEARQGTEKDERERK